MHNDLESYFVFCNTINFTIVDCLYENMSNKEMLISNGGCLSARVYQEYNTGCADVHCNCGMTLIFINAFIRVHFTYINTRYAYFEILCEVIDMNGACNTHIYSQVLNDGRLLLRDADFRV